MRDAYVLFERNPAPQILDWRARHLDRQADYNVMTPTPQNTTRVVPVLKDRLVESAPWRAVRDDRVGLPPGILCMFVGVTPDQPVLALPAPLRIHRV